MATAANILVFLVGLIFLEMGRQADKNFNGIPRKWHPPDWHREMGSILCDTGPGQNLGRWLRGLSLATSAIAFLRITGLLR